MNHRESLSQSRRSVTAVKDILVALLDAETGNRGYQLTGREDFLEPYKRGVREYSKALVQNHWECRIKTSRKDWPY
jgi:CHASE3 domain sensor protein